MHKQNIRKHNRRLRKPFNGNRIRNIARLEINRRQYSSSIKLLGRSSSNSLETNNYKSGEQLYYPLYFSNFSIFDFSAFNFPGIHHHVHNFSDQRQREIFFEI